MAMRCVPIKLWSSRPLAGGGVSLDWKQTWLPRSLWKTSQVLFAFLVSFRPSFLLEETAKNSPLAAQTMLTMVSLDNRKGRRKAIAWSTLGKWRVRSPGSLGPVTRFRAWGHSGGHWSCHNHDQQSTLSWTSTFFHRFLVDSKMKKHQQVMKSFMVYISNRRRKDVHWAYSKYFYTLSQRIRPIGQQAEWQPPPHLGRQDKPYRFPSQPCGSYTFKETLPLLRKAGAVFIPQTISWG